MRRFGFIALVAVVASMVPAPASAQGDGGRKAYSGALSLGYVFLDEEGSRAVNQPTFNTYEGAALSLSDFRYDLADGSYLQADLRNVSLKNRRMRLGFTRPGFASVTLRHNRSRHVTSDDAGAHTRRSQISGEAWLQPHEKIRFFGGYGVLDRRGAFQELYELGPLPARRDVDYQQQSYHAGARLRHGRGTLELEFRGSSFTDDLETLDDRTRSRYRISAKAPAAGYERLSLNGGFQHYEARREDAGDTLSVNTFWGGAGLDFCRGFSTRYSATWDRARRTGDRSSTDNIINSVSAQKVWTGRGGLSAGWQYHLNDDVFHDVRSNGFFGTAWIQAASWLDLRGNLGLTSRDDRDATTLTGDADLTRYGLTATFRTAMGKLRARFESRARAWDDIGSSADYTRAGADVTVIEKRYGTLTGSYFYMQGDYDEATGDTFTFADHVVTGRFESASYHGVAALAGGTYLRSKEDLDTERFNVDLGGRYSFGGRYSLEAVYTAHNFDDLLQAETEPLYTRYYTANMVEISLRTELGR